MAFQQQNRGGAGQASMASGVSGGAQAQQDHTQQQTTNTFEVDTKHEDNINDCQFDYYGTQIASVDSKGFIQISSVRNDGHQEPQNCFSAHEGPIWQVSWAHPKYESVIATCGYDNYVRVWKRDEKIFEHNLGSSVICIAWAPWEYGLILAAGTADGRLAVIAKNQDDSWGITHDFTAHDSGVNGISWGPATEPAILMENPDASAASGGKFQPPPKRLVTGGNDNQVMMWQLKEPKDEPVEKLSIGSHNDWVRDVAWCSNIGLMHDMIASCSEDYTCKVWVNQGTTEKPNWVVRQDISFGDVPLWKVSWSQVGNMLAISGGDNQVRIMNENANGTWEQIQVVNEETSQESSGAGPAAGHQ